MSFTISYVTNAIAIDGTTCKTSYELKNAINKINPLNNNFLASLFDMARLREREMRKI